MNVDDTRRDLAAAMAKADAAHGRDRALRAARQVVVDRCAAALGLASPASLSLDAVIRLAADAPPPARRDCAVLMVHALAIRGLVPAASAAHLCALSERALRGVLLRCGYPFAGSLADRMRVLERLHVTLEELMQPLQPTFPNWQGLYAG
jgi:hypothetical protein